MLQYQKIFCLLLWSIVLAFSLTGGNCEWVQGPPPPAFLPYLQQRFATPPTELEESKAREEVGNPKTPYQMGSRQFQARKFNFDPELYEENGMQSILFQTVSQNPVPIDSRMKYQLSSVETQLHPHPNPSLQMHPGKIPQPKVLLHSLREQSRIEKHKKHKLLRPVEIEEMTRSKTSTAKVIPEKPIETKTTTTVIATSDKLNNTEKAYPTEESMGKESTSPSTAPTSVDNGNANITRNGNSSGSTSKLHEQRTIVLQKDLAEKDHPSPSLVQTLLQEVALLSHVVTEETKNETDYDNGIKNPSSLSIISSTSRVITSLQPEDRSIKTKTYRIKSAVVSTTLKVTPRKPGTNITFPIKPEIIPLIPKKPELIPVVPEKPEINLLLDSLSIKPEIGLQAPAKPGIGSICSIKPNCKPILPVLDILSIKPEIGKPLSTKPEIPNKPEFDLLKPEFSFPHFQIKDYIKPRAVITASVLIISALVVGIFLKSTAPPLWPSYPLRRPPPPHFYDFPVPFDNVNPYPIQETPYYNNHNESHQPTYNSYKHSQQPKHKPQQSDYKPEAHDEYKPQDHDHEEYKPHEYSDDTSEEHSERRSGYHHTSNNQRDRHSNHYYRPSSGIMRVRGRRSLAAY